MEIEDMNIEPKEEENEIIEVEENNYSYSSEDEKVSNNNKKDTKLHTIKSKIKIAVIKLNVIKILGKL